MSAELAARRRVRSDNVTLATSVRRRLSHGCARWRQESATVRSKRNITAWPRSHPGRRLSGMHPSPHPFSRSSAPMHAHAHLANGSSTSAAGGRCTCSDQTTPWIALSLDRREACLLKGEPRPVPIRADQLRVDPMGGLRGSCYSSRGRRCKPNRCSSPRN